MARDYLNVHRFTSSSREDKGQLHDSCYPGLACQWRMFWYVCGYHRGAAQILSSAEAIHENRWVANGSEHSERGLNNKICNSSRCIAPHCGIYRVSLRFSDW